MSERFEAFDEALGFAFGVAALEVVAAEVAVELAGGEHVPAGADDRVLDGAERFLVAAPGLEAGVLRGEVGVFAADRGERGFLERPVEPLRSLAGLPGAALAGGLVVAGALAGPGGEVLGGREDAHVGADLGDDHLGCAPLNAGDRAEQLNGRRERGDLLLDRVREPVDLLVEEVDVGEDRADPQRVQLIEAALERLLERRELRAQPALAPGRRAPPGRSCRARARRASTDRRRRGCRWRRSRA